MIITISPSVIPKHLKYVIYPVECSILLLSTQSEQFVIEPVPCRFSPFQQEQQKLVIMYINKCRIANKLRRRRRSLRAMQMRRRYYVCCFIGHFTAAYFQLGRLFLLTQISLSSQIKRKIAIPVALARIREHAEFTYCFQLFTSPTSTGPSIQPLVPPERTGCQQQCRRKH